MKHTAAFMSERQDWATPQAFFDKVNARFGFTLDAAAYPHNAKCDRYYTEEDDALTKDWDGVVWCNPPYGRAIGAWVQKGYEESQKGATVVMLIPARTDTTYWHDYVMRADEVILIRGRLKFVGADHGAPFPSALIVFRPGTHTPRFTTMDRIHDEQTHEDWHPGESPAYLQSAVDRIYGGAR